MTVDATNRRGQAVTCRVAITALGRPGEERRGVIMLIETDEPPEREP
jgi:hypothetical protein